jgi:OFA family oxalate/formate antiporter-like MFS transporter
MACLMALWPVVPVLLVWPLLVFGFFVGAAYGQFVALCPSLMVDYFGTRHIGSLVGVYYTGAGIGSLIGPWLAGAIFDRTGSYVPAILTGAVTAAAGAVMVLRLQDAPRR